MFFIGIKILFILKVSSNVYGMYMCLFVSIKVSSNVYGMYENIYRPYTLIFQCKN